MEERGKQTYPARTEEVVTKVTCDLCGSESPDPGGGFGEAVSWNADNYNVTETGIYMKTGTNFPEGSSYEFTECDICPDCFESKLMPWLKAHGVVFRERNLST